jgi:multicomponent Na+:H+ antiporter subunit G
MVIGEVAGLILLGTGVFFSAVGIIGIIRLPDVYTRIHASGKVSTLGIISLLAGTALMMPEATLKLIVLALFLLTTAPVASHAIAAAAYRQGVPRAGAVRDDLAARAEGPATTE